MKGISCCGDCGYYNWKKHKCTRCESKDPNPRAHFFADCPLPDVGPIIRCRDCLYFCDMSGTGKTDICSYHSVMGPDGEIDSPFYTTPEAYCAWAERRDEECQG